MILNEEMFCLSSPARNCLKLVNVMVGTSNLQIFNIQTPKKTQRITRLGVSFVYLLNFTHAGARQPTTSGCLVKKKTAQQTEFLEFVNKGFKEKQYDSILVGGFNPSEKYSSNWIISPSRG